MKHLGHARNGLSGLARRLRKIDYAALPLAQVAAPRHLKLTVLLQRIGRRYAKAGVGSRSAAITYYGFLSLFPILITAGNLLPLFGLKYANIAGYLDQLIPSDILRWLDPIIKNLLTTTSGSVLSIGAVATLWAATVGMGELKRGYNSIYVAEPKQNFLLARIVGMLSILITVAALALVLLAFTFGSQFLEWFVPQLGLEVTWVATFNALRWPVALAALLVALLLINLVTPSVRLHFLTVIPGTIFTVITWMGLAQLFALYMRYFGTRYSSYGTIGSIMILLLWLNFMVTLLLIGVVINAEVSEYFYGRTAQSRRLG